jgi:NADPH:quinone reductase-like Zn-dependent oxidoreductase
VERIRARRLVIPERCRCVVEEFEIDASALAEDQVLLQTEVSLVSTGTELANYSALDPGVYRPGSWNAYPYRPGYAAVGRVLRMGGAAARLVPGLREGRRVFAIAPHASHAVLSLRQRTVFPLEEDDDPLRLVLVRMASVAITALRLSRVAAAGKAVAVIGLGLVGNFAAQLFQLAGHRVIAFDPAPRRVQLARSCGLRHATGATGEEALRAVKDFTDGAGADIVVEAIGNPALIPPAVAMCRTLGEVILLGSPRGPLTADTGPCWSEIHHRGIQVVGALEWLIPFHRREAGHGNSIEENYHRLIAWIRDGQLRVDGMVSHVVPPERCQETYDGVLADRNAYFGICFDWTGRWAGG